MNTIASQTGLSEQVPELAVADRNSFFHPFTAIRDQEQGGGLVVARARGSRITDVSGREYIDGAAGLWCVNVGYGRSEISKAIEAQSLELPYFHTFNGVSNEPGIRLSEKLLDLAPSSMRRVFYGSSGSDANDSAVKLLWNYNILRGKPEKRKIISRTYAYHGVSIAAGSLTGIPVVHQDFGLPLDFARHVSRPDLYRDAPERQCHTEEAYSAWLAEELDQMITSEGEDTVAGFVAEPVMGTGGVLPPPRGYFEAISRVLEKHDVRLVADEVITGFGRVGAWFASQLYDIKPDLILTAKGLTSGYLPMSAILVGDRIWSVMEDAARDGRVFAHGFTYSGHPTCAAAALANLAIIEREGLVGRVADMARPFHDAIEAQVGDHDLVGDIRSVGLMLGVEFVADRQTREPLPTAAKTAGRIALAARRHGALVRALPNSDVIALSPPFIITEEEISELASALRKAIEDVASELKEEGMLPA
ncbi:MAG: putative aminotransferase y4uB [Rhizobiaceae bacterium MnEN-MB40S]|nr:MAG: putative aminotransferase y4uB [Rhizobiaceae bacterium MnEN-MB40S]